MATFRNRRTGDTATVDGWMERRLARMSTVWERLTDAHDEGTLAQEPAPPREPTGPEPPADPPPPAVEKPPASGPGSGRAVWVAYIAARTGRPAETWDGKSRDDVMAEAEALDA
jgi:hypothetical protein